MASILLLYEQQYHCFIKMCIKFALFFNSLMLVFSINKIQLKVKENPESIRSQLMGYGNENVYTMKNYRDIQYYAYIQVGTPGQKLSTVFDTGSHRLWVPVKGCLGCSILNRKYNPSKSSTYQYSDDVGEIQYGKGYVEGYYGTQNITFEQINVKSDLLFVVYQKDFEGTIADGILGLSNEKQYKSIFDIGYQQGELSSSTFAFELGLQFLKEPSNFYYNITSSDFPDAHFIKASRKDYWTIPLQGMFIGETKYKVNDALIDTGTSLTVFNEKIYGQLDQNVFSELCDPYSQLMLRKCSCDQNKYPNLTFVSSGFYFNMTPKMYVFGLGYAKRCYLGLDKTKGFPFMILGDNFLQHNTVIFDKTNNEIGLISNIKEFDRFVSSLAILYTFDILMILIFIGFCAFVCIDRSYSQSQIRTPLKKPIPYQLGMSQHH